MPIVRNVTAGSAVTASAKISRRFTLSVGVGASNLATDAELQVNTLPNCFWYVILQTGGVAGVTFTPQFAVDNAATLVGTAPPPQYFPLHTPIVLALNVPVFVTQRIVANMISGIVTVPGEAAGDVTVQVILAASI